MKCDNPINCNECKWKSNSLFRELAETDKEFLFSEKNQLHFKKGQQIFQEGTVPRGLYCIQEGKVKIAQLGNDGKEIILHLAKGSDIMGHRAILGEDTFSCSAYALEDTNICFIPRSTFVQLVKKNTNLSFQILQLLARELKESETRTTIIAQSNSRDKIIQSLNLLIDCYGFEHDGKTIDVIVSREELANLSGTTRETAIRVLTELKDEHLIDLDHKKIIILDRSFLCLF